MSARRRGSVDSALPRLIPRGTFGLLLASVVVLPPLLWLAGSAGEAVLKHGPALLDATALRLLGRSLLLAASVAAVALAMGAPFGWLAARYRLPARGVFQLLSLLPILLPPYAGALAWSMLLAREGALNQALLAWGWIHTPILTYRSAPLIVLIQASSYWPILAWLTLLAARSVPPDLEDSARLHLPEAAAARWTAGPVLLRALPAGALLVFLLALGDFGVANTLGLPTYPVEIVNRFNLDHDAGMTARLAGPLLLVVAPLVLLQIRWLERIPLGGGSGGGAKLLDSLAGRWGGGAWCLLVLVLTSFLPLGVLFAGSLPLRTYPEVWQESSDHFLNTLITAGGGALLALALALRFGWSARGRRLRALDLALTLPYALPGSLLAIAAIQLLNPPGHWRAWFGWTHIVLGWLGYGTGDDPFPSAGLVWIYVVLFFPFAHKGLQPAWGAVDSELLDEGAVLGAGEWSLFRAAAWPVLRPFAAAAGAVVALLAAREIDATALLRPPDGDTVAFRIQDYLHFAPGPNVAALCIILVALSGVLLAAVGAWAWRERD